MNGLMFNLQGPWAHFKRPETNNNPLSHDIITKTALIGLIGAVIGIDRTNMKEIFPLLSEGLLYGVRLLTPVKKESWAFTLRSSLSNIHEKAPKHFEFIKNPEYIVTVAQNTENEDVAKIYEAFKNSLIAEEARYTPVLGLHNCPAELKFIAEGQYTKKKGRFKTSGFFTKEYELPIDSDEIGEFKLGFDKVPTFQNNDFWNPPERYKEIIYPVDAKEIEIEGEYYSFAQGSQWAEWVLI